MNHDHYPDSYIRHILKSVHTIAVLGASPNDARPSYPPTRPPCVQLNAPAGWNWS